ncbi:MAG TPA: DUF1015 domain-containing protein [Terracidiphilus sp.]|jgi:uncharacterized protein (DUF1015 family)|nr:DUF1015 domain-containing protein [Terracidiphilus sp.]
MARIYPFRAWRYNPSAVRLNDVVTQPHDQISPAMQQAYYQSSPYNVVRITLGLPELFDAERGESVYTRAARDFRMWREEGVLAQEKDPCVFAYAQRFTAPGTERVQERRGFIALGKLYDYAEQVVFRHEQTLQQSENDRLNLLQATRAHFEQIFMLYSDPARTVEAILFDGSGAPDVEVTDEHDVTHRLWRVSDPATIRLLTTAMADKKLIIADGHDGYETALNDARARGASTRIRLEHSSTRLPQPPYPEAAAMMTFVNMDADGLAILPTHRVVRGLAGFDAKAFLQAAEEFFVIDLLRGQDAESLAAPLQQQNGTAFVAVTREGNYLLRAKPEAAAALGAIPERLRQLDLTHLRVLVLERLLGVGAEQAAGQAGVRCVREAAEAVEQVRRGEGEIAFLTNPVTMEQVREVAFAGDMMAPDSTDFYPRLLSGLAVYALE